MLLNHIKPYWKQMIFVVLLILLQAACELSLPDFMSDIVNTGIGQSGVSIAAPVSISEESMHSLFPEGALIYDYYASPGPDQSRPSITAYAVYEDSPAYLAEIEPFFIAAFQDSEFDPRQQAVSFILSEYNNLGIDTSAMQTAYILSAGGKMLLLAAATLIAASGAGFMSSRVSAGFARDLRKSVFSKTVSFSNTEFDKFSTASLITRSTNDIQQLQGAMSMGLRIVIFAPFMGIGAIVKVIETEAQMSWILAVSVAGIIIIVGSLFAFTSPKFKVVQKLTDRLNLVTREALTGMLVIRAFATEKQEERRFMEVNTDIAGMNRFISRSMGTMMPLMGLIMNFTVIAVIYFGARYVAAGFIQVGSIMAFIQYSMHVIMSFLFVSMISIMLPRAMVSAGRVNEVLKSETNIKDSPNPQAFPPAGKGLVEFNNVSFKYPDADEYVLKDISFSAEPGQTTAFIGSTGSGKSTLMNLIPRFYDATGGSITVDGIDIRKASLKKLRDKISYAPQKGLLFSGTIESNIKFAGEDLVSGDEMLQAAKTAQAHTFIMNKEKKYQDAVAQGGVNVSGGQRQRLSIARALAKKSDIIIFDDSFSALDYKTDAALRKELSEKLGDKTILIVAQRIATIRNAEKIVVLDQGGIAGIGTHDSLMESCEVYRQIALSQIS